MHIKLTRIFFVTILIIVLLTQIVYATMGTVVYSKKGLYILFTLNGYSVMEWFGGMPPLKGSIVIGNIEELGFQTLYDDLLGEEFEVFIENIWLSEKQAVDWLLKK